MTRTALEDAGARGAGEAACSPLASVGEPAPDFDLPCANVAGGRRGRARLRDYVGSWLIVLFYPRDFSFVCPTELARFSALVPELAARDCRVLAMGVDPVATHEQWLAAPPEAGGVGPVQFPIASDEDGSVSRAYGAYVSSARVAGRGLFIVDPSGVVQYAVMHNLLVGRSADETLRVLDALRAGGLCPESWTLGDGTLDPSRALSPGRVLGHYRIERQLGQGGFGQVFEAWDLWLHRSVALKVLRPGRKLDHERILEEARPAARVRHPNICAVLAVEVQDGLPVIAMEFLDGEPLSSRIRRGALPPDEARSIARHVARAMAAAHAAGVTHGDLKPGNVMLTADGGVKVLDFGLGFAPPLEGRSEERPTARKLAPLPRTESGAAMFRGTPQYMTPEHALAQTIGAASDVYGLGLVLYEMLTGKRANSARSLRSAARLARSGSLQTLARPLPQPFRALVTMCLSPAPEERPTMAALEQWLTPPPGH